MRTRSTLSVSRLARLITCGVILCLGACASQAPTVPVKVTVDDVSKGSDATVTVEMSGSSTTDVTVSWSDETYLAAPVVHYKTSTSTLWKFLQSTKSDIGGRDRTVQVTVGAGTTRVMDTFVIKN